MNDRILMIGQLARQTGTKVETIRFYEKNGLLPAPSRTDGNYALPEPPVPAVPPAQPKPRTPSNGCHNRAPFKASTELRDHHGRLVTSWPFRMASDCQYQVELADVRVGADARIGGARKLQPFRWGGAYMAQIWRELFCWK